MKLVGRFFNLTDLSHYFSFFALGLGAFPLWFINPYAHGGVYFGTHGLPQSSKDLDQLASNLSDQVRSQIITEIYKGLIAALILYADDFHYLNYLFVLHAGKYRFITFDHSDVDSSRLNPNQSVPDQHIPNELSSIENLQNFLLNQVYTIPSSMEKMPNYFYEFIFTNRDKVLFEKAVKELQNSFRSIANSSSIPIFRFSESIPDQKDLENLFNNSDFLFCGGQTTKGSFLDDFDSKCDKIIEILTQTPSSDQVFLKDPFDRNKDRALKDLVGFTSLNQVKLIAPSFVKIPKEKYQSLSEIENAADLSRFVFDCDPNNWKEFKIAHIDRIWDSSLAKFAEYRDKVKAAVGFFLEFNF